MITLIKNGTLVNSDSTENTNILIEGKTISQTGKDLSEESANRVIDATGCMILPGGVDPHVHMHLPAGKGFSADDFYSGGRAALYGGTTTLLDFVTPHRGESLTRALEERKKEAGNSPVDFSFHVSPVEWRETTDSEIKECRGLGITSFKIYMAYKSTIGLDDTDIRKVLNIVAETGGMVTVHCELGDEIEKLRTTFCNEGKTTPLYHALSRPAELEAGAVERIINMAARAQCPLYIVHVSSAKSLDHIRRAQSTGQKVFAETCPQYLLLDDSVYNGNFNDSAPYVISPPLRNREDNDALWRALADNTISTIGTDHCPFNRSDRLPGKDDFRKIPNGAGGVEHRLQLLYTYGVTGGKITINRLVELFSTAPAKLFGLYPQKGTIAPGSDADMVIWDPSSESKISALTHHQNCDSNIYEGTVIKGTARYVISGGRIAVNNGIMTDELKTGCFIPRQKNILI
jgi:dihydropyrimidinase